MQGIRTIPNVNGQPRRRHAAPAVAIAIAFFAGPALAGPNVPTAIVLGDVDGDGKDEVLVGSESPSGGVLAVHRWVRSEQAVWHVESRPLFERALPVVPRTLIAGDLDADGAVDVAIVAPGGLWWIAGPDLARAEVRRLPLPGIPGEVAAGEFGRRDGLLDLALSLRTLGGFELWLLSSGAGAVNAVPVRTLLPAPAETIAIGLLDDDRRGDVAIVAGEYLMRIFHRDDAPPAVDVRVAGRGEPGLAADPRRAVGRIDGDARDDVAVVGPDGLPEAHLTLAAHTYTVTSTADGADAAPGDGQCDDGSGACTLRAAIMEANAAAGSDDIRFSIPGAGTHAISPASALPTVTEPVAIDGRTQPGYAGLPLVELVGSGAGNGVSGLVVDGGGSTVAGIAIDRFDGSGVELTGSGGNLVVACHLGTDPTGALDLGNGVDGITVGAGAGNVIGGTSAAERNVIAGNDNDGIDVVGATAGGTVISGNYIGVGAAGSTAIPNAFFGIYLDAVGNTVGGSTAGSGNVISGNGETGVAIRGADPGSADDNVVQGNRIGTDAAGGAVRPNGAEGILVREARDALIGGTTPSAANLVSGNLADGIFVRGRRTGDTTGLLIQGNVVGGDVTGTAVLGNGLGGVVVRDAEGAVIGGSGAGNLIIGNGEAGVHLLGAAQFTSVAENLVGVGSGGQVLGNGTEGVLIENVNDVTVAANAIAHNAGTGIVVTGTATRDRLTGNAIHGNGALAIDLTPLLPPDGVTPNDPGDGDAGPNGLQNHPLLTSVARCGTGTVQVSGTLESTAATTFTVELFASPACDPSGRGEGELFLGTLPVTTDGAGNGAFGGTLAASVPAGWVATATTTAPTGSTSEMSPCVVIDDGAIGEVASLGFDPGGALSWSPVAGASEYRVYRGGPGDLPALLIADPDSCLIWSGTATSMVDSKEPAAGELFWYLVVAVNDCGEGPAGDATTGPRQLDGGLSCN